MGKTSKRASSAAKLRTPDDLDKHVRVTSAGVWVILGLCCLWVAGVMAWAVFGTLTTNVVVEGACLEDGEVVCFLSYDQASHVETGDAAVVGGKPMTVSAINPLPLSSGDAANYLNSDFLANSLIKDDWVYPVRFEGQEDYSFQKEYPLSVSITTDTIAPISFVLGGRD